MPSTPSSGHRMRAELVVEALMGALAEQIEIEIGQDRRKAVGVLELDDIVAERRAQLVARRAVRQAAREQAGIMDARRAAPPRRARRSPRHCRRRQERRAPRCVTLGMEPEIVERIGVAAFDDRIGFGGQFSHAASSGCRDSIRSRPVERHAKPVRPVGAARTRFRRTLFQAGKTSSRRSRAICDRSGHSRRSVMASR